MYFKTERKVFEILKATIPFGTGPVENCLSIFGRSKKLPVLQNTKHSKRH
jgi:hypothetical protein